MSKAVQQRAFITMLRRPWPFLKEVRLELAKVKWPDWPDIRNLTMVVIITIVAVGCYLAVIDAVVGWLFHIIGMYR